FRSSCQSTPSVTHIDMRNRRHDFLAVALQLATSSIEALELQPRVGPSVHGLGQRIPREQRNRTQYVATRGEDVLTDAPQIAALFEVRPLDLSQPPGQQLVAKVQKDGARRRVLGQLREARQDSVDTSREAIVRSIELDERRRDIADARLDGIRGFALLETHQLPVDLFQTRQQ